MHAFLEPDPLKAIIGSIVKFDKEIYVYLPQGVTVTALWASVNSRVVRAKTTTILSNMANFTLSEILDYYSGILLLLGNITAQN